MVGLSKLGRTESGAVGGWVSEAKEQWELQ